MRLIVQIDLAGRSDYEVRDALRNMVDRVGAWRRDTDTHNGWHLLRDPAGDPVGRAMIDTLEDL